MEKFINRIRTDFILKMLSWAVLLLFIPELLVLFLGYRINYSSLGRLEVSWNRQLMENASGQWEQSLQKVAMLPLDLYEENDANIMGCLRKTTPYNAVERTWLENFLTLAMTKDAGIFGIDITGNNGEVIRKYQFVSQSRWQTYAEQMDVHEGYNTFYLDEEPHFSIYHASLTDYPSYSRLAEINIYFSHDEWERIAYNLGGQQEQCSVVLMDGDGKMIYSYGTPVQVPGDIQERKDGIALEKLGGTTGYLFLEHINVQGTGYSIVKFFPVSNITGTVRKAVISVVLINIVLLVFILSYLLLTYTKMIRPVNSIAKNMRMVQQGIYSYQAVSRSKDEIGNMDRQYEAMVHDLDYLINQKMRNELELEKSKMKMLQAQINPHFLNNILQMISTQALFENALQTNKSLCSLARMMQYTMDIQHEEVCLKEELAYIGHYLQFQKERYDQLLNYEIHGGEETLFLRIPKMILQPLVENAVKYSALKDGKKCRIEIGTYLEGDDLCLYVSDDGAGFSEEKLEEIGKRYQEDTINITEGHGIGLLNVLLRLKVLDREHFSWNIENNSPGCTVSLRFAAEEVKNESTDC